MASVEFYKYYQLENGEYFRFGQRKCTHQILTRSLQWEDDDRVSTIFYNHSIPYSQVNDPAVLKRLQSYDKQKIAPIVVNRRQIDFPAQSVIGDKMIDAVEIDDDSATRVVSIYFSSFYPISFFESVAEFFTEQGASITNIRFNYEQDDDYYHADPIPSAKFQDYPDYQQHYWERCESNSIEGITFRMMFPSFENALVGCSLHFPSEGYCEMLHLYYPKRNLTDPDTFFDCILDSMISHE